MCEGRIFGYEANGVVFSTFKAAQLERSAEVWDRGGEILLDPTVVYACCNCGKRATQEVAVHHCCDSVDCRWLLAQDAEHLAAREVVLWCMTDQRTAKDCPHEKFVYVGQGPTNTIPVTDSRYRCHACGKILRGSDRLPCLGMTVDGLLHMRNYFQAQT